MDEEQENWARMGHVGLGGVNVSVAKIACAVTDCDRGRVV